MLEPSAESAYNVAVGGAERVRGACKGSLALTYSKEENLVRATWVR